MRDEGLGLDARLALDAVAADVVVGDLALAVGGDHAGGRLGGAHELAVLAMVLRDGPELVEDLDGVDDAAGLGCLDVVGHLVLGLRGGSLLRILGFLLELAAADEGEDEECNRHEEHEG